VYQDPGDASLVQVGSLPIRSWQGGGGVSRSRSFFDTRNGFAIEISDRLDRRNSRRQGRNVKWMPSQVTHILPCRWPQPSRTPQTQRRHHPDCSCDGHSSKVGHPQCGHFGTDRYDTYLWFPVLLHSHSGLGKQQCGPSFGARQHPYLPCPVLRGPHPRVPIQDPACLSRGSDSSAKECGHPRSLFTPSPSVLV